METSWKTFEKISLPVIPSGASIKFRKLSYLDSIDETQQCLLDNLWSSRRDTKKFLNSMNALSIFFQQKNNGVGSNNFSFFVVFRGRLPGIYSYWSDVLQQVENFPSSSWKGFHSLGEATKATRDALGPNYFTSKRIVELSMSQTMNEISLNSSVANSSKPSSSFKIEFCNHCETMVKNFKLLNIRCQQAEEEREVLRERLRNILEKKPKLSYPDTGNMPFETFFTKEKFHKVIVSNSKPLNLSYLPSELRNRIYSKAKGRGSQFHEFLFEYLSQLACGSNFPEGISFTWDCHYDTKQRVCPKIDPYCISVPLYRDHCKCHLVYSIPRASIELQLFKPLCTKYQGEEIFITISTLLDYGFLKQIIFSDPDNTNKVGRKLAICVNKYFVDGCKYVIATIESKMPEWTDLGNLIPAQHIIYLNGTKYPNLRPQLFRDKFNWPCSHTARRQIRHHRARAIAWNLFDHKMTHYKLVTEDLIQKIKSSPLQPPIEVPFKFYTLNTQLHDFYQKEFLIHTSTEQPQYDEGDDDGQVYWDNMGVEEYHNVENMIEG